MTTTTESCRPDESEALAQRVAVIESEVADVKGEVRTLATLREQLQRALGGMRQPTAGTSDDERVQAQAEPAPPRRPNGHGSIDIDAPVPRAVIPLHGSTPPRVVTRPVRVAEVVTIIHLEDRPPLQEALRAAVEKFGYARYCAAPEPVDGAAPGRRLLAVNLLLDSSDPLAVVVGADALGIETPCAFTYCADGTRGLVLGMVDFFPPPFEPDACVTRLLERPAPAQRLLVVSDALDATTELRSILTRLGCATSVAFDVRQALDLVPMVRPDVILVDLNLPRGEALRVASRVRSDPMNANVTFALMWQTPIKANEFQAHVGRIMRDLPLSSDELRRAMSRELSPGGAGYVGALRQAG